MKRSNPRRPDFQIKMCRVCPGGARDSVAEGVRLVGPDAELRERVQAALVLYGFHIYIYIHYILPIFSFRTHAFKLQPLDMGEDLTEQLEAIAVQLEKCGKEIQLLIQKKKNKNKHYVKLTVQVVFIILLISTPGH